jgi:hypothetical protein
MSRSETFEAQIIFADETGESWIRSVLTRLPCAENDPSGRPSKKRNHAIISCNEADEETVRARGLA